ncbi:MAG TPA: GNAT family N-acetyltransferase [Actinomycetota bacterium]|nr:GNAT family N-acetyltransferase [Actinomycetota bacterium]
MPLPDHVATAWRRLDRIVADVRETPWGAVVTDPASPAIWDTNYARVERPVGLAELERDLLPALARAGVRTEHIVSFDPVAHASLVSELTRRGHTVGADAVLDLPPDAVPMASPEIDVEELPPGPELWVAVEASFGVFGVEPPEAAGQLLRIERDRLAPAGKRWFGVREPGGAIVSIGALVPLGAAAYVDNVATLPRARRRGAARAITVRIVTEARSVGTGRVFLLADPGGPAVRLYERLGFREVGRLETTRGPVPDQPTNL